MVLTLPYPTLSGAFSPTGADINLFAPTIVHSDANHNDPHAKLLANDVAIAAELNGLSAGVIESTYVGVSGTGATYLYTYIGNYVPLSINVSVNVTYPHSNLSNTGDFRWLDNLGVEIITWQPLVKIQISGGSGGIGAYPVFNCTLPFLTSAKTIEFRNTSTVVATYVWKIISIQEHKISRWGAWGY